MDHFSRQVTLDIDNDNGLSDFSPRKVSSGIVMMLSMVKLLIMIRVMTRMMMGMMTMITMGLDVVTAICQVKVVFIMARVHPGETPASFVVQVTPPANRNKPQILY